MKEVANILLGLLSAYIVFEYYKTFFEVKKNSASAKAVLFLCVLWQIISTPDIISIPPVVRLVLSVAFVFIMGVCFAGSLLGKIVFGIIYHTVWVLSEVLVSSFFLMENIKISNNIILGSLICELYLLLLVKLLQLFFRHKNIRNFSLKYNGLLMIIPIAFMMLSCFLFTVCAKLGDKSNIIIAVFIFIFLMIAMFIVFMMYIKLVDSYEVKRKSDIYEKELELHTEYIKEKEYIIAEFNKNKHDLKNNLIYMLELLNSKEYTKLEKYLRDTTSLSAVTKNRISNTDNSILDSFINYKYDVATEKGIEFRVKMDVPYDMPFDNGDLCVILGNALDNAIEANEDKIIEKPYIDLKMRYREGNLVIIIENTFDGKYIKNKDGIFITTKKDKNNHGIGLSSIKNALQKYNGQLNIETEDKLFKISIIMFE